MLSDKKETSVLFCQGKSAYWQVIKKMNLKSEADEVIIPAYICRDAIAPFEAKGITLRYYDISKSLTVNMVRLMDLITYRTRLVVVVHYFGFVQDMQRIILFCLKHHLKVMEDCALAYGSRRDGQWAGNFADFALFSLMKYFPIPDGGLLLAKEGDVSPTTSLCSSHNWRVYRFLANSLWNGLEARLGFSVKGLFKFLKEHFFSEKNEQPVNKDLIDMWEKGASVATLRILNNLESWKTILEKRRKNYLMLIDSIKDCKWLNPVFEGLPEGICPMHFPVLTKDREYVRKRLESHGVPSYPWPYEKDLPHKVREHLHEYPVTSFYIKNLLLLPIHQSLMPKQMNYIQKAIEAL